MLAGTGPGHILIRLGLAAHAAHLVLINGILLAVAGIGCVVVFIMTDKKKTFKKPAKKETVAAAAN